MAANVDIIIRAQNQASGAIGQVQRDLGGLERAASGVSRGLSGLQSAVMGIGVGAAVAGIGALTAGLVKSVGVAADFEAQMNVLGVAARSSGTAMNELSDAALAVGSDTDLVGVSASEAANAMTNFYKAGLSTNEIFDDLQGYLSGTAALGGALRSAVDLAAASELDLAAASDVVAVSMATFGLSAADASRIADTLVQAADSSLASVGGLSEGLVNVGPVAASMGMSLEEVSTALAILSTRGIQGSEAGTAMRSMLLNLQRPTKAVQTALDELGVSLFETDGTMRALPDIIGSLESAMAGLTEEQRNQYATTLAGTYGLAAFQTLVGEGVAGWEDMATAIENASSAQEIAAARTKGFSAAMEQLWGSIETFMISVGTPLIQVFLTPAIQAITEIVGELTKFAPTVDDVEAALAIMLTTGQQVLTMIGGLIAPITEAIGSFISWKDVLIVLGGVAASIVIPALIGIVTAAAPVIAVFAALVAGVALVRTAWESNWGGIQEKTATALSGINAAVSSVVTAVTGAKTAVDTFLASDSWTAASTEIGTALGGIGTAINQAFTGEIDLSTLQSEIITQLSGIGTAISTLFQSEAFTKLSGELSAALGLDVAAAAIATQVEPIKAAVQPLIDFLTPAFERLKETVTGLGAYFANIGTQFEPVKTAASELVAALTPVGQAIAGLFSGGDGGGSPSMAAAIFAGALSLAMNVLNGLASAIAPLVSGALAELTTVLSGLATIIGGLTTAIGGMISGDTAAVWAGFGQAAQGVADILTGTLSNALGVISGLLTALGTTITGTLSDWGFTAAAASVQGVIDKVTALIGWLGQLAAGEVSIGAAMPEWIARLLAWTWPSLPSVPKWLTDLIDWLWPGLPSAPGWLTSLLSWAWPGLPAVPNWLDTLLVWAWPSLPSVPGWLTDLLSWEWPSLPSFPALPSWLGGAPETVTPGSNAAGTAHWRGGLTWVGEAGRELVQLPRGSRIYSNRESEQMVAAGGNVTVYATVSSAIDVEMLAYRVANVLARA